MGGVLYYDFLLQISKGGAAKATGKLRLGDRILEVSWREGHEKKRRNWKGEEGWKPTTGGGKEVIGFWREGKRGRKSVFVFSSLQVNKFNVRFSTHQQAVQWLISQEGDIELVVQHVPQPPGLQVTKGRPSIRGCGMTTVCCSVDDSSEEGS